MGLLDIVVDRLLAHEAGLDWLIDEHDFEAATKSEFTETLEEASGRCGSCRRTSVLEFSALKSSSTCVEGCRRPDRV